MTITLVVVAAALLLAVGYAVIGLLVLVQASASTARQVLPVLNTEAAIAAGALFPFLLPPPLRAVVLAVFAARVLWEATSVAALRVETGWRTLFAAGAASATVGATAAIYLPAEGRVAALLGLAAILAGIVRLAGSPGVRVAADVALFPGLPLGLFLSAAMTEGKIVPLLLAMILVETFDSYALLGGKLFGRRPAFPRLSPGKTVEGLAAGAIMLLLTAAGLAWTTELAAPASAAGAAIAVGVLAVAGDLAASRLKRASGVKDYPPIIRLQGGVLDIADASLAVGAMVALIPV